MGQLHEMHEKMEHIDRIAHGDFLDTLAAIMPYLIQRREIAKHQRESGSVAGYEYLQAINKEIAEILSIF